MAAEAATVVAMVVLVATEALRGAMRRVEWSNGGPWHRKQRDLRQLRSAIATAEEEKVVEASVIEEAKALYIAGGGGRVYRVQRTPRFGAP